MGRGTAAYAPAEMTSVDRMDRGGPAGHGREDADFLSSGLRCAAWLYRPVAVPPVAAVVMAHGFGGVRIARLEGYAARLQAAGYAVLLFDYRHFGDSDGEPRGLLDISRQREDWAAAVAHARGLDGIDPERIIAWGTSFSGGHAIATAARDPRIAAVVAQVPHVSGVASALAVPLRHSLRLTVLGMRDELGGLLGRAPRLVPALGAPGDLAVLTSSDAPEGRRILHADHPDHAWEEEVTARVVLRVPFYSPGWAAGRVRCPLLIQATRDDEVTPARAAERASRRAPRGELLLYDGGHFAPYAGELFTQMVGDQIAFLQRVVPPRQPT